MPAAEEFKTELHRMMLEGIRAGRTTIDITAGELHKRLGNYPDPHKHRMPVCCCVMKEAISPESGDKVLNEPPSGQGSSLTIRYVLPRPC
jgi:hypothetical protein